MAILVDTSTRVLVQTYSSSKLIGGEAAFHTAQMVEYGTQVVAIVNAAPGGWAGQGASEHEGIPVFNAVREAVQATGANAAANFVPAPFAADTIVEAAEAGVELIVCITEGIPVADMIPAYHYVQARGARLVGPNCPGVITPGQCKIGIMPGFIHRPGSVGVISRSGTLTYEAVDQLTQRGLGQSTCIGIGGDPVIGTRFVDALKLFRKDEATAAVVVIGEIGGTAEEEAAAYVRRYFDKPVVGFIAGRTAPPGRRMGHAGAIISGGRGTADEKMKALKRAGIAVCESPADIGATVEDALKQVVGASSGERSYL